MVGPFAVPDYARGSYTALLTIRALSKLRSMGLDDNAFNYSTALDLDSGGKTCEIDFDCGLQMKASMVHMVTQS